MNSGIAYAPVLLDRKAQQIRRKYVNGSGEKGAPRVVRTVYDSGEERTYVKSLITSFTEVLMLGRADGSRSSERHSRARS